MVDSGASISLIKYNNNLNNFHIFNETACVNGLGGKSRTIGTIKLPLKLNIKDFPTFNFKFHIIKSMPCDADGIIGTDFMDIYCKNLNFIDKTLTFINKNVESSVRLETTYQYSQNVLLIEKRSELQCFITAPRPPRKRFAQSNDSYVVCGEEISPGVFIANALVTRNHNNRIPIRILNTTEHDITLNNFVPKLDFMNNYSVYNFDKTHNESKRVKQILSLLKIDHLNKEEATSITNICAKYSDIFLLDNDKLTTTNIYEHDIKIKPGTEAQFTKAYRLPHSQKEEIDRQIKDLIESDIIEPAKSEWSSPILLVPKKADSSGNKKWRLVVDYRKLNNYVIDDKFPLANITEILDSLSGCVYFSHLDLFSGFYQVPLSKKSRKYTAFSTHIAQYQLKRMPMGLKTSPSAFSRTMHLAMSGLTCERCLVYQDDLVVFGQNLESHNKNLLDVFERLRKVNLKLNMSKCEFLKKEMLYLGHVVSEKGVLPDPAKIESIRNYPIPTNVDEVRRFVAFCNYYRKYIKNFADLTLPLNKLLRKGTEFNWTKQCQTSFDTIKQKMMSPPVLAYPNFDKNNEFVLQTDASNFALGSILSNSDLRPIAYASRTLNKAELNYPIIQKELLSIVWSVRHFRPYLYGRKFKILTDHRPLIYLFGMKDPSSRLLKFRLALEEYDFTIEYVKGTTNTADALSRVKIESNDLFELNKNNVVCVLTRAQKNLASQNNTQSEFKDPTDLSNCTHSGNGQPAVVEILQRPEGLTELRFANYNYLKRSRRKRIITNENNIFVYIKNNNTIYIKPSIRSRFTPDEFAKYLGQFCKSNEINKICYINNSERNKIFLKELVNAFKNNKDKLQLPRLCILNECKRINDKDEIKVVLNDFHILPTGGHAGTKRMYNNIRKYYYWSNMEKDINDYVKLCSKCQTQKYTTHIKQPMEITSTANSAFEKIFLDIVGPLDRDDYNYTYILTIQCELTKYVEAFPLHNKSSAEMANCFVNNFILKYGLPSVIATDRGTEFTSQLFKEVCTLLKINKLTSTAYHHQSIGALENTHKSLNAYLRIQTDNNPHDWSSWLPFWTFSYNTTTHSETKYTPYELVFGKRCILPSNLTNKVDPLYNFDDYPKELKFRLQMSQQDARKNLIKQKVARKIRYDQYTNEHSYKPGDYLLVKNETAGKLENLYSGPYEVIEDISPNVKIKLKHNQFDTIHKNRTKPYYK